jgi:cystathionine beta-lyase/cystathionine gamma-synthase
MSNGSDPFELLPSSPRMTTATFADAVVPPIFQTSLFTFSDYDDMIASYRGEKVRPIYTRGLNPTVRMFEEMLAKLEGAEDALGFASGMAAISSAVLSFVEPGDRIVAVKHVYPDAFRLFGTILKRMKVEVTYVDGRDEEAIAKALPGAKSSTWKARRAG